MNNFCFKLLSNFLGALQGRFAGFSFANRIKWDTICAENGKNVQYSISVYSENKNEYEVTEKALTERSTGTTVIIGNVDQILPEQVTILALEDTQLCRWRFIAVCNNVDDDVRARYATNQTKGKKGLVFSVENYELYALTWADVFKSFELRHSFLLKKLKIDQEAIEKDISQQLGNSTGREAVNNLTALALPVSMISG